MPSPEVNEYRERDIESFLTAFVEWLGGETRKVKWIGRRNAPDRYVMLPWGCFWLELKRPGKEPTAPQRREHEVMRGYGERVEWANTKQRIGELCQKPRGWCKREV